MTFATLNFKLPDVWHPHTLSSLILDQGLTAQQLSVYTELINQNHQSKPLQLEYFIPVDDIGYTPNTFKKLAEHYFKKKVIDPIFNREITVSGAVSSRIFRVSGGSLPEGKQVSSTTFRLISRYQRLKDCTGFNITLTPEFKVLLGLYDAGFSKGDIRVLRQISSPYTFWFYWYLRKTQQNSLTPSTFKISIQDFRKACGVPDSKYKNASDFTKKVLKPLLEFFQTFCPWSELKIEAIRGLGGNGRSIWGYQVQFKKDVTLLKDLKLVSAFDFEGHLEQEYGFSKAQLLKIRHMIVSAELIGDTTVTWSGEYVRACIAHIKALRKTKKTTTNRVQIKNPGAYLNKCMMQGTWLDVLSTQTSLPFQNTIHPVEMIKSLYEDSNDPRTFKDFIKQSFPKGYIKGDQLIVPK